MVQEINLEGELVYKCEKCGWLYREIDIAKKCENYCGEHYACNLRYSKFAIKPLKLIK